MADLNIGDILFQKYWQQNDSVKHQANYVLIRFKASSTVVNLKPVAQLVEHWAVTREAVCSTLGVLK